MSRGEASQCGRVCVSVRVWYQAITNERSNALDEQRHQNKRRENSIHGLAPSRSLCALSGRMCERASCCYSFALPFLLCAFLNIGSVRTTRVGETCIPGSLCLWSSRLPSAKRWLLAHGHRAIPYQLSGDSLFGLSLWWGCVFALALALFNFFLPLVCRFVVVWVARSIALRSWLGSKLGDISRLLWMCSSFLNRNGGNQSNYHRLLKNNRKSSTF